MTDRYEKIRQALAKGPTPGPFSTVRSYSSGNQELILSLTYKDEHGDEHGGIYCTVRNGLGDTWKTEVDAAYIAACDPDTIAALLKERDALLAAQGEAKTRAEQLEEAVREWWKARRPVGWTEDQHRSCPHVNLVTGAEKALADALLRDQEKDNEQ